MGKNSVLKKLRSFGYDRSEEMRETVNNNRKASNYEIESEKDFSEQTLNHTIMEHYIVEKCIYNKACVTGSIFRSCKFTECSLDQADFEFCEFYDCEFQSGSLFGTSFNNSSFINTRFCDVHFDSCTLTGAFFQDCLFDGAEISVSTLENALFRKCSFWNVDYRYLNMDYVELDAPNMKNAVLPLDQIPFMFGALQYIKNTRDSVSVSMGKYGRMSPKRFYDEVIPLLCTHFDKTNQFFPLANIYYAMNETQKGQDAIKKGLTACMTICDFRMLKYFCKLIAYSGVYRPSSLHDLYNNYICRLYPQYSDTLEIPNYSRHILEIKSLLFSTAKKASFRIVMRTGILLSDNEKLGKIFESIFSIGKLHSVFQDNDIEAVLQQNSPLVISVCVSGDEMQLIALLRAYLSLTGIDMEKQLQLPVISQCSQFLPTSTDYYSKLMALAQTYRQKLADISIQLTMLEYYVENFRIYTTVGENYYFNSNAFFHKENVALSVEKGLYGG